VKKAAPKHTYKPFAGRRGGRQEQVGQQHSIAASTKACRLAREMFLLAGEKACLLAGRSKAQNATSSPSIGVPVRCSHVISAFIQHLPLLMLPAFLPSCNSEL
jgi:hypothetical protein